MSILSIIIIFLTTSQPAIIGHSVLNIYLTVKEIKKWKMIVPKFYFASAFLLFLLAVINSLNSGTSLSPSQNPMYLYIGTLAALTAFQLLVYVVCTVIVRHKKSEKLKADAEKTNIKDI